MINLGLINRAHNIQKSNALDEALRYMLRISSQQLIIEYLK